MEVLDDMINYNIGNDKKIGDGLVLERRARGVSDLTNSWYIMNI